MKKARNIYEIVTYIAIALFAIIFGLLIILYATNHFGDLAAFVISLIVGDIVLLFVAASALVMLINERTLNHMLSDENEYSLGVRTAFNNLSTFIHRTTRLRFLRRNRNKEQYVIAFTASNQQIVRNYSRNDSILRLNYNITNIIGDLLENYSKKNRANKYLFGLDKGTFFVYTIGLDETNIRELIENIKNEIYNDSLTGNYRIWIEPIFGVCKVNKHGFIGEYIDDAIIARNVSERNFEGISIYHESFRRSVAKNDTDEIIEALKNDEFVVYYQPKFDLNTKEFTSSEALIRWNSKKYGLLPPSKFIATAEAAGLIHDIDKFVFKRVCEDIRETKRRGRRLLPVSVNFSLYEFFSAKFLDDILNMLDEYHIDSNLIQIEITETTSMANPFLSVSIIKKLREKGIKILMDDFGVGFSNIGNLRKIPFDIVKIDKSFVDNIETDQDAAEIIRFLINVCKVNGFEVVAEGVDNVRQVEILKKYKCDVIQGYYYSKPISKLDYDKFLIKNEFEAKKEGRR